jgi:predicted amidophosphoribosyltransferase
MRCKGCGAELEIGPEHCPLCGAEPRTTIRPAGARPRSREPVAVDDYQASIRKLRAQLRRLRDDAEAV